MISQRLAALRTEVHSVGGNVFYTVLSDEHLSEYIPERDKFLTFLTGFTGSNAELIVTDQKAYLWTDSRYWEQAKSELAGTGIELMKAGDTDVPAVADWLAKENEKAPIHLVTPLTLLSASQYQKLIEAVAEIIDCPEALIDRLWDKRPAKALHGLYIHHASSVPAKEKKERLQAFIRSLPGTQSQGTLLLTRLDDIAWLTNLRGSDIAFNPVFLSWVLISADRATIFLHRCILKSDIEQHLSEAGWEIKEYGELEDALKQIVQGQDQVLAKTEDLNAQLFTLIGNKLADCKHPVAYWKSIKTPEEIAGLKEVMKADGKALEDFIAELKDRLANGESLTENDAVDILHQKRAAIPGFIGESFGTIAAVDANAALPHYEPIPGKGAPIIPPCVLLVDSGAHYDQGTTDTTRVWFLGDPKDYPQEKLVQLKRDYTAVYQGMTALMKATFKPGTTGLELDEIAKAPIHAIGADFGHGTGHGIGLTLNVHETPPNISSRKREGTMTPFVPGMIVSDEPGIYRPGLWGIRIENMLLCVEKENGLLGFESLKQCSIDQKLLSLPPL